LARALDRSSIAEFILQKEGEAAGGLLPQWSSGTAFLFSAPADISTANEHVSKISGSAKISVGYDAGDALEQAIAERVAVNAREAGIAVMNVPIANGRSNLTVDARLVRLRMCSPQPREALAGFLNALAPISGISGTLSADEVSSEAIYERQRSVIGTYRVIPLVWLPQVYGLSARVRNWKTPGPGQVWPLADIWLDDSTANSVVKVVK
jgi:hypothetical protein